jgi:prophage regulatory protein
VELSYTSILRISEVCRRTGLSKSQIHRLAIDAEFPRPVRLGKRAVGWVTTDIEAWLQSRISASRMKG